MANKKGNRLVNRVKTTMEQRAVRKLDTSITPMPPPGQYNMATFHGRAGRPKPYKGSTGKALPASAKKKASNG